MLAKMLHYSCLPRDYIKSQFYRSSDLNILNRMNVFSPILSHGWVLLIIKMSVRRNKVIVRTVVYYCICHTINVNMFRPKYTDFQTGHYFSPQMYQLNAHIYLYNNVFTIFLLQVSVCYTICRKGS